MLCQTDYFEQMEDLKIFASFIQIHANILQSNTCFQVKKILNLCANLVSFARFRKYPGGGGVTAISSNFPTRNSFGLSNNMHKHLLEGMKLQDVFRTKEKRKEERSQLFSYVEKIVYIIYNI